LEETMAAMRAGSKADLKAVQLVFPWAASWVVQKEYSWAESSVV